MENISLVKHTFSTRVKVAIVMSQKNYIKFSNTVSLENVTWKKHWEF